MAVVGFRVRDADQLTNKWDGLIKDYKKTQRIHRRNWFGELVGHEQR
jgi:hypothetical protein